jgi:hypothetical protein
MYGNSYFYNETTRRYVAVFGTHFNDLKIQRRDNSDTLIQEMTVPIHYAPMQKILARLEQDPNLDAPAMTLPRMSFEIVNMLYDPERKLGSTQRLRTGAIDVNSATTRFVPVPYNLEFELNIMTKYNEDGTKILEQILPFFRPEVTPTVQIVDGIDPMDIPIILNSVTKEDVYEGSFEERRALIWTLTFTMKGWFFGPTRDRKLIKFAEANVYTPLDSNTAFERVTVYPGLDANGDPTTDPNTAIDWALVSEDDDWATICIIEDLI